MAEAKKRNPGVITYALAWVRDRNKSWNAQDSRACCAGCSWLGWQRVVLL
jgi:hypothetical protein